jgi:cytoskeletal protein RodZ
MTARQDARVGSRATSESTWSYETQRAPNVGEILQTARERKGVDLSRAERETKIRARHLVALEHGDLADLPAQVYAKGFLRNYSTYLGLDADEVLARWRKEIDQPRSAETPKVKPPPQPITAPSRGFKLTSSLVVALVLATVVLAFVGYIGLQLVRFTQNPDLTISGPVIRQVPATSEFVQVRGGGTPNAEITASGPYDLVRTTTADAQGNWTLSLPVNPAENRFVILGTDPETGRDSDPREFITNVDVLKPGAAAAVGAPALPEGVEDLNLTEEPSAELTMTEPRENLQAKDGKFKVVGTTDAETVRVSFQWRGNLDKAKRAPPITDVVVEDGVFRQSFQLPKGRWFISATAAIDGGVPAIESIPVKSLADKMLVKIAAIDGQTRVKLLGADGDVIDERVLIKKGKERTWSVDPEVVIQVGNARAANVTVDGVEYGAMGNKAEARAWRIKQGEKPKTIS